MLCFSYIPHPWLAFNPQKGRIAPPLPCTGAALYRRPSCLPSERHRAIPLYRSYSHTNRGLVQYSADCALIICITIGIRGEEVGWNYLFSWLVLALHLPEKHVSKLCLTYDFVASLAQMVAPGVCPYETQTFHIKLHSAPTASWRANMGRGGIRNICRPVREIHLDFWLISSFKAFGHQISSA